MMLRLGYYYLQSRYYDPQWGRFINADGIADTLEGLLSANMYIYCYNNPINLVDPTGYNPGAVAGGLLGGLFGGPIGAAVGALIGATVVTVGTVGLVYAVDYVTTAVKEKVDTIPRIPSIENYTVYTLREGTTVQYVGLTSRNPLFREAEHKLNPLRAKLSFNIEATGLTRLQARGLEQGLIDAYKTLNNTNPMNNQRNGIAWDNPKRGIYMDAASPFLTENITYVGP